MNVLTICLTITSLVGIVTGQGYSLIPNMQPVSGTSFGEDVSKALQNAAQSKIGSTRNPLDSMNSEPESPNIDATLKALAELLKKNHPHIFDTGSSSAPVNTISKRSIVEQMNESEKVEDIN